MSARTTTPAATPTGHHAEPRFRDLTPEECDAILARNEIGRIAFAFDARVDVQPIHYAFEHGRLFLRTSHGEKLVTLRHSPWVAFEVDEIDGSFDWRSVVVHGTFYLLPDDGAPAERRTRQHAMELLRHVLPATGTPADPVAFRDVVCEIVVDTVRGRAATSRPG